MIYLSDVCAYAGGLVSVAAGASHGPLAWGLAILGGGLIGCALSAARKAGPL